MIDQSRYPGWPDIDPPPFIDNRGRAHDWDDRVEAEDGDDLDDGPTLMPGPYTYRDLAYDIASARGQDVESYLMWHTLANGGEIDDDMTPEWLDDEEDDGW